MNAQQILDHLLNAGKDWVDPAKTVDRIITGDPEKEIKKAGVTWISSSDAVRKAVELGLDLLVTHEPTFWDHFDEQKGLEERPQGQEKKDLIDSYGLVILRCHDVWDRMPDIGIPWAWARFLGFKGVPAADGWKKAMFRFDIEPVAVDALAAGIAARVAEAGEPGVQVIGDGTLKVSRVGIGTGCICVVPEYQKMGCDAAVVTDDGSLYWKSIQYAQDTGFPLIRVNHGVSEEPGMKSLTEYMQRTFPDLETVHIPHSCTYRYIQ